MRQAPEHHPFVADVTAEFEARAKAPNGSDTEPSSPPVLKVFSAAKFKGIDVPSRLWIVPNYIPDGTPTLLSGDGGTGKSWITLQLAVARALARDWLGLLPEPGSTLVLSAEDDEDEIHRRLDSILRYYTKQTPATWGDLAGIHLADLVGEDSILAMLSKGIIEPTPVYRALDAYMGDFKPGLVTLDVLADMFSKTCAFSKAKKTIVASLADPSKSNLKTAFSCLSKLPAGSTN